MGRMRVTLAVALLALGACSTPSLRRGPLLELQVDEPWSMGDVASRSPVFALYDDGQVIYFASHGQPVPKYATVTLTEDERARLMAAVSSELDGLDASYFLAEMTHHPVNTLRTRRKTIMVYGELSRWSDLRGECPPAFLKAYDALRDFKDGRAVAWRPDRIEIWFGEHSDLKSAPHEWPAGWPGLTHPDTRKVEGGYWLYVDYARVSDLAALWENSGNSDAYVEISGRLGLISYRVPFPGDRTRR